MKILPLFQLAAAPNLALTLARIARTPRARLATVLRLASRCPRPVCCRARHHGPLGPPGGHRQPAAVIAAEARRNEVADHLALGHVWPKHHLGEALLVDRLVTGVIIGSKLDILGCEAVPDEAACAAPRLDVWA
jgi:hypothetical protein